MSFENLVITDQILGEGSFGSVFVSQMGEMKVAAKKLLQSENEFNDLVREASGLKRLQYGKHIAYTYGISMKEGSLYMVMEYGRFGDLKSFLNRNAGSVTYEKKILFCRGILLGLLYCHSMNVFHGDINCSNVVLGKNLEPKLIGFSLSMTVDDSEGYCKTNETSLYWTAPELLFAEGSNLKEFKANPYPSDVYSLGATFCEISYDGTTEFLDSEDIKTDISSGLISPTPKDAFLEEIIVKCCKFDRNERISLDKCLSVLDAVAEIQLPVTAVDDMWLKIQQDIKTNSKLELPSLFILHRPAENLVINPSNLSLLEWLCINNSVDGVKYVIQLHEHDQNQIKWLYEISELCKSSEVAGFLQSLMQDSEHSHLRLSNFIDDYPQQFVGMLVRAGASGCSYSFLKKAIEKRHNMIVKAIIDSRNNFRNWAIQDAIKFGNTEAVKIIANAGTDLKWKDDPTGNTPLNTAIDIENIEIVKILLEFGVDAHSESNSIRSGVEAEVPHRPLYLAALKDNREIVKLLIDAGATMDITSTEWHSLSQSLEQQGNISMVRFISNNARGKSTPVASNPLCAAIRNKQPDLVQTLISDCENIDEIGLDGYAPLHWAVIFRDEEIARILTRVGVDLDVRTLGEAQSLHSESDYFSECTPLHIAVAKGHFGIAKLLIESGADFSAKNELQQTIMDIAQENRKSLEEIIRECVPVNIVSIQRAMKSMSHESIKMMISDRQVDAEILSECLCIAISNGRNDMVKYLLECGVNINKVHRSKTPLEWAVFGGDIQTMEILINAGADINAKDQSGRTPLIQYVKESNIDIVQFLVDKGADVNTKDKDGNTSIHFTNDREIVEILINAGADVNAKDQDGRMPLIQYVKELNIEMVQFLVNKGADVNARDKDGKAPIYYTDNEEIIEILINAGADINAKDQDGRTPLVQYVKESNIEMVQFLVNKGADVNAKDNDGNAPIYHTNDKEIVRLFTNSGVDVNATDQDGKTPLIQYVSKSNIEMVQFLVDKGADVNARDKDGKAPICYTDNEEIVEILINAGADINAKDQDKRTSLIQCVKSSNTRMVQYLVAKGADVNARDKDSNAPIHFARDKEIAEVLVTAGADVNAKDSHGKELFDVLMEEQNVNLSNKQYEREKVCKLLEYLKV